FITRHQVQEAAVHHWDAAHAAGQHLMIAAPVAIDSIEEFLTFSVSSEADPGEPARPALNGTFVLRCTDGAACWTVTDGSAPGTVAFAPGAAPAAPAISRTGSDLLLWLYGRASLETSQLPAGLPERFRALCFTG